MDDLTPRDDELTDPAVRQLLWRLRARLVAPPREARAQADLDAILAAARHYAHDAPDAHDGIHVDDDVEVVDAPQPPVRLRPVAALSDQAARRAWPTQAVGRVAAALLLVVAVGGGLAGARDVQVSIQALLGTSPATDDLALDAPTTSPPDGEVAPEVPADDTTTDGLDDAELPEPPSTDEPVAEPAPAPAAPDSDGAEPDAPSPEPAPEPEPAPSPRPAPAPEPAPVEAEEIVAAPPPARDLDGFGGPQPCPEDQDLLACLEERAGADAEEPPVEDADEPADPADDGTGAAEDPATDEGTDPDDDPTPPADDAPSDKDDLARRRGA
jgi:outer membrane biosynthesis protein TonB